MYPKFLHVYHLQYLRNFFQHIPNETFVVILFFFVLYYFFAYNL